MFDSMTAGFHNLLLEGDVILRSETSPIGISNSVSFILNRCNDLFRFQGSVYKIIDKISCCDRRLDSAGHFG